VIIHSVLPDFGGFNFTACKGLKPRSLYYWFFWVCQSFLGALVADQTKPV